MTRAEEQAIIALAKAGDRSASEALIRHHQNSLVAYLVRLTGRPETAEDVAQEAFYRALTHLDRFDDRYRFSTWIFTIARRLFVNGIQKSKPLFDSEVIDRNDRGSLHEDAQGSADRVIGHEQGEGARDAVQMALLTLPVLQREIILLFHMMDWSIVMIAEHLEIPEGTVKSHLHRARMRMRDSLKRNEAVWSKVREMWS